MTNYVDQLHVDHYIIKNAIQSLQQGALFITGGGGAGKSHLIKTIYHTVVKTYRHAPMNPENPTVLLAASTGVAVINIDGTHSISNT